MITAILLSGIIQGGFLALMLLRKPSNQIANRILAALILVLMSHLFLICLDVKDLFLAYPHFSRLSWLLPLLYGPLILLLTQSITDPDFRLHCRQWLSLLPFAVYFLILLPYFALPAADKLAYLSDPRLVAQQDFGRMNTLTNYLHVGFVVGALATFYRNLRKRTDHFSNSELIDVHWLKEFLWIVLSVMLFSVVTFYARKYRLAYLESIYPAHFLLVVVLVYWIAFKLLHEKTALTPVPAPPQAHPAHEAEPAIKYAKSSLSDALSDDIAQRITTLMHSEKPYLDNNLTLVELAARLDIPRHQLSQVINTAFGVNFFEFVNQYRLQEFKIQALDPSNQHLSLLGIALECGFNSKATFNQAFKKLEGTTPSDFVRKSRESVLK
ncbi:AraC-like DNA-binding protein [Dyadobacter sp. BE34]|uniref:AraC-like DNA-binding protein n=1 Tax=Dyadobacter fermentans TaxID=94254 RepID=A0ABU1QUQ2_9BACT|nr:MULTISPECIES: helix-turn-helix domain-containing protein [Dyadobacter]MDR6804869.1 AraC-like DNA-binding protein [Dyadobacter fermentans]MDR7043372.1 AraC-like DNA-binding protein [Dyadobacter sp. BE242]MDR7197684.1 AraC-like DNA-binding protein [Dyadobacter sp. BE34]MDR7214883.1 AraC-like DNA-binding protein [Dyadobacter sp. BE31]MDR7262418.1 AraC-like DNA-binding protein [Dyadobacter sp. BE32]